MVPKQRKPGQSGGDRHRGNFNTARARGGSVKPPSKSCSVLLVAMVAIPALVAGMATGLHII